MKQLTKEEMKKIIGGVFQGCSMTYQDSNGGWHTETGSCDTAYVSNAIGYDQLGPIYIESAVPFCHTASFSGPVNLTSNGGVSRCGAPS